MLEQAMKEVTSREAQREIGNARTAIRCMAEIINERDREDRATKVDVPSRVSKPRGVRPVGKSGERNIILQLGKPIVRINRNGKWAVNKTCNTMEEAITLRDKFYESEKQSISI